MKRGSTARRTVRPTLTPAENKVMELMAEGLKRGQIAEKLFVSENTIKSHLLHAYRKLGVAKQDGWREGGYRWQSTEAVRRWKVLQERFF